LANTGFDFSVLSEFRKRVAEHGLEARALDLLVAGLVDEGLIKPRGRQRTGSTHAAPRSALSYPWLSREELEEIFLGLMPSLGLSLAVDHGC